ncbi:urea carboxylase, partial [Tremellales sp. Uapishka_1]
MLVIDSFQRIRKVLIANRGEIACRIIKSCKELGLVSIAIYSKADRSSAHVRLADEAWLLPGNDQTAYITEEDVLDIARRSGAHAVIPGYGFLSENAGFAEKVEAAGLTWVGPSSEVIQKFGLKHTARELAVAAGVPIITGTDLLNSADEALAAAERIGYPVMLKATAGGGGMGLQICWVASEIESAFASVLARGATLFNNTGMFMEKYVAKSRHVEVQVFGNGLGDAVHFGERECSIQRRHQKVVEECPSPFVHGRSGMREELTSCAVSLASNVCYGSAGTIDTRLQVEHGITEMCYDVDLVSLMLQQAEMQARGKGGLLFEPLSKLQKAGPTGFAIEARVYAEVPSRNFAPSPGLLQNVQWYEAPGVRVDTWITSGTTISPFYDPMIAKVIVWDADSHDLATDKMLATLTKSKVQGCPTNFQYLAAIIASQAFRVGDTTTAFLTSESFSFTPVTVDVISGGAYTTIQDLPARKGVGNGVPESGPMDPISFRLANVLVGNDEKVEGLEITLAGPELLFHVSAIVAVTGGVVEVTIDGEKVDMYSRLLVPAGKVLRLGSVTSGCRAYLAIKGGFPSVPNYLGSKSTTSTLKLGGFQGRHLLPNDSLELDPATSEWVNEYKAISIPPSARLDTLWTNRWELFVMPGPHDEPEFVTEEGGWITHNATRSGYRLKGPRLNWAREDGGEGGSHPANVIDEPYSYGGLNWNGDDPVILPIDAPMCGGLVTTTTIVRADFWRLGQCRPGDSIRFKRISWESARILRMRTEAYLTEAQQFINGTRAASDLRSIDVGLSEDWEETILHRIPADEAAGTVEIKFRQAGDSHIHVTYGPMTAGALTRAHIQHRINRLNDRTVAGVVAVIGAARSYCVQFDSLRTVQKDMLGRLVDLEKSLGTSREPLPSRIFKFPILLDDPVSKEAVTDYMETVRSSAVYLPDNMEYIAKANGITDCIAAAKSIVACPQLVVELSFLAGTPLLLPMDPRLVYVAQKYNPVRAFTAEGTVGLGGPLLVIYPLESPGGYQIWGRSLSTWDAHAAKPQFEQPWLLREFDQIQFYEVNQEQFDDCYERFKTGRFTFEIEETTFDPVSYGRFLDSIAAETEEFVMNRNKAGRAATVKENRLLQVWREAQSQREEEEGDDDGHETGMNVEAPMTSSVWKILVAVGDVVTEGQTVAILEAMKMEIAVRAEASMDGKIDECYWEPREDYRKPLSRHQVQALTTRIQDLERLLQEHGLDPGSVENEQPRARGEHASSDGDSNAGHADVREWSQDHLVEGEAGELQVHGPTSAFRHLGKNSFGHAKSHDDQYDSSAEPALTSGFARYLPQEVYLSERQHEAAIDRFFRFYASWAQRTNPILFRRDMNIALYSDGSTKTPNFSPLLHNAILSIALGFSDEAHLRSPTTRKMFAQKAKSFIDREVEKPCIATVQALAHLASYHSLAAEHNIGWMYIGMALRCGVAFDEQLDQLLWENKREVVADSPVNTQPGMISTAFVQTVKLMRIGERIMNTLRHVQPLTNRSDQRDESVTQLLARESASANGIPCLRAEEWPPSCHDASHDACLAGNFTPSTVLPPTGIATLSRQLKCHDAQQCDEAALQITSLLQTWHRLHDLRFSPPTALQCCFIAGTTHLLAMASSQTPKKQTLALARVQECTRLLGLMAVTWPAARQKQLVLETLLAEYGLAVAPSSESTLLGADSCLQPFRPVEEAQSYSVTPSENHPTGEAELYSARHAQSFSSGFEESAHPTSQGIDDLSSWDGTSISEGSSFPWLAHDQQTAAQSTYSFNPLNGPTGPANPDAQYLESRWDDHWGAFGGEMSRETRALLDNILQPHLNVGVAPSFEGEGHQ